MRVFTSDVFIFSPHFCLFDGTDRLLYHDVRNKEYYLDDSLCLNVHYAHLRNDSMSEDLLRVDRLYCSLCNNDHDL